LVSVRDVRFCQHGGDVPLILESSNHSGCHCRWSISGNGGLTLITLFKGGLAGGYTAKL